jgi:hypothetical protein
MILGRRALIVLPSMMAAGAASAQTPGSVWYAVRGVDHSFIVDMPGEPVYKLLDTRSPAGTPFVLHSYSLEAGRFSFVAQTALLPPDIDVRQPRSVLQGVLDERAQRLAGGKWSRVDWREVLGVPAADSLGAVAGGNLLRQLALLRGRRLVTLACLASADALRTPEVERFFGSLRFAS